MRRSTRVFLLAVAVPGALSPVLYAALGGDDGDAPAVRVTEVVEPDVRREVVEHELRVEVVEHELRVEVAEPDVHVRVLNPVVMPDRWRDEAVERARVAAEVRVRARAVQAVEARSGSRCEAMEQRTLDTGAGPADLLDLDAGSGELVVEGVQGLEEVRVTAILCASDEERLAGLDVVLERRGERIRLETRHPSRDGGVGGRSYARIDLRVEVPRRMAADIRDSSGEMRISGVGALTIDDSSGEIEVVGADGDVRIDDSSGEIVLRDVAGSVDVQDGSGEIEIRDVQGSVVLSDGSGSIEVRDVERDVRIARDGSGSIEVHEVGGDFVVERDGSGGIRFTGVRGRVDVPDKG